jgi:hypothetical protein
MHYRAEIIMPPTDDVEAAISLIMEPFDENSNDEDYSRRNAFWDWWVIGGRWAGQKGIEQFAPEKVKEFYDWCSAEKITAHGVQCGKQEISPADQIPKVDSKWNEMFPRSDGKVVPCPIFRHSGDSIEGDILPLSEAKKATASTVIFAGPSHDGKKLEAKELFHQSIWNGVTHQDTSWNGTLSAALVAFEEKLKGYRDEYATTITPKDDWLVVTVDYHS